MFYSTKIEPLVKTAINTKKKSMFYSIFFDIHQKLKHENTNHQTIKHGRRFSCEKDKRMELKNFSWKPATNKTTTYKDKARFFFILPMADATEI